MKPITRNAYLHAHKIIEQYHKQIDQKIDEFKNKKLPILDVVIDPDIPLYTYNDSSGSRWGRTCYDAVLNQMSVRLINIFKAHDDEVADMNNVHYKELTLRHYYNFGIKNMRHWRLFGKLTEQEVLALCGKAGLLDS